MSDGPSAERGTFDESEAGLMNRTTRTAAATAFAAVLAISAGGAARADRVAYTTIPDLTQPGVNLVTALPQASRCDANLTSADCEGGLLETTVFSSFQLNSTTKISGIDYYSYFVNSVYRDTIWSIWQDNGTDRPTQVVGPTVTKGSCFLGGPGSTTACSAATAASSEPSLVSVGGLNVTLTGGVTYWLGIQNDVDTQPVPLMEVSLSLYAVGVVNEDKWKAFIGWSDGRLGDAVSQAAFNLRTEAAVAPEPATWAMTLAGFAALALAAGRRRIRMARKAA